MVILSCVCPWNPLRRVENANAPLHAANQASSKKVENRAHAVALHVMYYNFVRIHQTLKISPAMTAGVTDKLWEMSDMVKVLEEWEAAS
jgi:hypothetical protein